MKNRLRVSQRVRATNTKLMSVTQKRINNRFILRENFKNFFKYKFKSNRNINWILFVASYLCLL